MRPSALKAEVTRREEGNLLLSSSEGDLLQQLLEAVVSKHARDDGSGKVTFILQKHM